MKAEGEGNPKHLLEGKSSYQGLDRWIANRITRAGLAPIFTIALTLLAQWLF